MGADEREWIELRVSEVRQETSDARSFAFSIPQEHAGRFAYAAGQFLTFRVPWNDWQLERCYSLCSAPEADEPLRVAVKRVEDGRVSNWFNDRLTEGDRISVLPPEGRFVLRESERPVALFAGGSGITPVISLLKSALVATSRRLKLVYANRDAESIIFRDELGALAARHPERIDVVHHLDADRGFLDAGGVKAHLAGWEGADFYLCGPAAFMDIVETALSLAGAPRERTRIERFVSPTDPDRRPEARDAAEPEPEAVPEEIAVRLDGELHRIPYVAGQTVLEAARAAGLEPPFACEEGYCSTCMARLTEGRVVMRANDALTERDVSDGFVLTCQSVPQTAACAVDWDDC